MSVINVHRKVEVTPSDKSPFLLYFTSGIKSILKSTRKSNRKRSKISGACSAESFRRREESKRNRYYQHSPRTPAYKRLKSVRRRLNFDEQNSISVNVEKCAIEQNDQTVPKILFSLYDNNTLINADENNSELYIQYTDSKAECAATPNIHHLIQSYTPLKKNKLISYGHYGCVVETIYKTKKVAVKLIKNHKNLSKSLLQSELNGIGLKHPNIITTKTIAWTKYNFDHQYNAVIMECFYESKNLLNLINNNHFDIDEQQIVSYTIDVCKALQYLHSNSILHLNVKPKNILVFQSGMCKLFDFGASMIDGGKNMDNIMHTYKSSIQYCSPELLLNQHLSTASDVYSLGITIWQMIHRSPPYGHAMREEMIFNRIRCGLRPKTLQSLIVSFPLQTLKSIYINCWEHEPSIRCTIDKILIQLENIRRSQ